MAGICAIEASYASRVVIVHDPLYRRRLQTGQFADETHAGHMWRGILGRSAIILSIAFDIVAAVRRRVRSTLRQSSSGRSRGFADMASSLSLGLRFEVERSAGLMGDVHRIRPGMSRRRRLARDTAFAESKSRNARGAGLAGGLPKRCGPIPATAWAPDAASLRCCLGPAACVIRLRHGQKINCGSWSEPRLCSMPPQ